MRISIWAVESICLIILGSVCLTYNVVLAEPLPPSNEEALPITEQRAEPEGPVTAEDTATQISGKSADNEDPASRNSEQRPDADAVAPSNDAITPTNSVGQNDDTDPPISGKKSAFRAIFNNLEMEFTLTAGLRKDDFQWSIAGNSAGNNPNVRSELTWSDVDSYQLTLTNRTLYKHQFYFRGDLNYAFIQNGRVQDSDYNLDNRRDEYSRSISDSSGDQIWDISLAGGYPFFFLEKRLMVAPLFGISYHKQNLRITDGEQVITSPGVAPLGPLPGLDSSYQTVWMGPWVGCDLRYRLADGGDTDKLPMEFGLSVELHYADYEAEANWNLRNDLEHPVSFEHDAEGYGISLAGEWLIGLGEQWDFVFRTTYQYWQAEDGQDRAHNANGTEERHRLNEVAWHSHSSMIGVNFNF